MVAISEKLLTIALVPGKPETKMPLTAILRKEKQAMQAEDKKLDTSQKQPQSSTVVNISAKARELNRAEPVAQTSSAAKAGSSTDKVANVTAKGTETNRTAPVVQPPPAVNTGSPAAPAKKA